MINGNLLENISGDQPTQLLFDCIIVGLGGHGSAAAAHLALQSANNKFDKRILGIEKFSRAHALGSSHGRSRIIRQAYFEDPRYVPLLQRSFELWRELASFESENLHCFHDQAMENKREPLLNMTGGLMIGMPDSTVILGTLASVREHSLPHEILDANTIHARYPCMNPIDPEIGVLEQEAGID